MINHVLACLLVPSRLSLIFVSGVYAFFVFVVLLFGTLRAVFVNNVKQNNYTLLYSK